MSVFESIANVAPVSRFRRRHEAVRAGGARAVRNSFEDFDSVVVDTANFAKGSFGDDKLHILRTQIMQEDAARNGESRNVLQEVSARIRRGPGGWGHDGLLAGDVTTQGST